MTIESEIALVTGASRGIGQAVALELGRKGAIVMGTSTSENGAHSVSNLLNNNDIQGSGFVLDVGNAASVNKLFAELKTREQLPTILVNNAGINRDNLLMRMTEEDWEAVINTNLSSHYRMCRSCVRYMMKKRKGRIINITSVVALTGNAGQTNYAAAKAGILGFTKTLAREVGSRGITVNAVAPGFIDTDMTNALTENQRNGLQEQIPLGKLGKPEDIAYAVAFLASPQAGYITGETLHVNGGMYMA
jgi:3-oxoacyl-[acyl-carrier protein] reductase